MGMVSDGERVAMRRRLATMSPSLLLNLGRDARRLMPKTCLVNSSPEGQLLRRYSPALGQFEAPYILPLPRAGPDLTWSKKNLGRAVDQVPEGLLLVSRNERHEEVVSMAIGFSPVAVIRIPRWRPSEFPTGGHRVHPVWLSQRRHSLP
jgi:hypothetical protein